MEEVEVLKGVKVRIGESPIVDLGEHGKIPLFESSPYAGFNPDKDPYIQSQQRSEPRYAPESNDVNKAGRNFLAMTAGLPGDFQDISALRNAPRQLPNSDELVDKFGGDREHWSYWPAALLSPGPGELKVLGAAAMTGAVKKGNALLDMAGDYSSRFPTKKAFDDWRKATPDNDPAKRDVMYEVLDEQRQKIKAGAKERDGRPLGSPKGMTHQRRTSLINQYVDRIERGIDDFPPGYFYEEGRNTLRQVMPDREGQNVLGRQINQTSTQVGPAGNVNFTVRGREQRNAGTQINTGIYPNVARQDFNRISDGERVMTGYKRDRYGNLLTPQGSRDVSLPDESLMAPNDRWEFKAAGFDSVPTDPKSVAYMDDFRDRALAILNDRREQAGLHPLNLEQAQEVHWAVIRAESEGRPLKLDPGRDQIGGAFDNLEYSHTYEAKPGKNAKNYLAMDQAAENALLDTQVNKLGRDRLVEGYGGELQRPVTKQTGYYVDDEGVGTYAEGRSARSFVSRTAENGLIPESAARVKATEATRALALGQDAYAGNVFTPINPSTKSPKYNGINFRLAGEKSASDVKHVVDAAAKINPDIVVVDSPNGIRAFIPGDTSAKSMRQLDDLASKIELQGSATKGRVESDFDMLDWQGGNATQDVLEALDDPGFPGIVEKANSQEVRAVLGDVAEKYEAMRNAGFGVPNEKLISVLKTWAKDGLPAVREMVKKGLAPAGVLAILIGQQQPSQNALMPSPGET